MSQKIFKQTILPIRIQLLNIARNMLNNDEDAEDAVQEVLLKLWRLSDSLSKYDNPSALAVTTLKNHCLDKMKLHKKYNSIEESTDIHLTSDNPHQILERKNTTQILMKIIKQLPKLQQMIITMKDVENYELNEIADITGASAEAIRMNLSRARKTVREQYIKHSKL